MSLHPYQTHGARFLTARRYAYLADDMGLGKTVQACAAAASLARVLVICPAVARPVWAQHWREWGPQGPEPVVLRQLSDPIQPAGMVIVSYEYARVNAASLAAIKWDVLILDEAHMAKSHAAQRTRAIFGKSPPGIARSAARVWWLSGTPIENHPGEIWLPMYFAGKTRKTHDEWIKAYCEGYDHNGAFRVTGAKTHMIPALRQELAQSDLFLRRTRKQVFPEIPPRQVSSLTVEAQVPAPAELDAAFPDLDGPLLKERLRLETELLAHALGSDSSLDSVSMAVLQGIAQSVSTLRRYSGMLKVAPVVELLKHELDSGQLRKVALFYVHDAVGAALMSRLARYNPVRISGATDYAARDRSIESFNFDPECRVFIGQLRACGVAMTLSDCTDVMAVETGWDPSTLAQALHRVRREPGDTTPIFSRVVTLDEPLDKAVSALIARKAREIQAAWA